MLKMAKALDLEVPKALFVGGKADMNPHLVRSVSRKNQDFLQACCRSDSYIADPLLPALVTVNAGFGAPDEGQFISLTTLQRLDIWQRSRVDGLTMSV